MTDLMQTRITIKPAGIAILAALSVTLVAVLVNTFRGYSAPTSSAANAATNSALMLRYTDASMSPGEIEDKNLLAQLNATEGQERDWLFLGPLPAGTMISDGDRTTVNETQMRQILTTAYLPGEVKYQAQAGQRFTFKGTPYKWRGVTGSAFDFKRMFMTKKMPPSDLNNRVVYGYTTIESKTAAKKVLHFRSDDGAVIWLNGEQVHKVQEIRGVNVEDVVPLTLRAGKNSILVKVAQGTGGWGMAFLLDAAP